MLLHERVRCLLFAPASHTPGRGHVSTVFLSSSWWSVPAGCTRRSAPSGQGLGEGPGAGVAFLCGQATFPQAALLATVRTPVIVRAHDKLPSGTGQVRASRRLRFLMATLLFPFQRRGVTASAARTAPASPPASTATACGTARTAPTSSAAVSPPRSAVVGCEESSRGRNLCGSDMSFALTTLPLTAMGKSPKKQSPWRCIWFRACLLWR